MIPHALDAPASDTELVPQDAQDPQGGPMSEIVRQLRAASAQRRVTLGALVAAVGDSSFLPVLMVPAMLVVSPLSGIPLFSTLCGVLITFVAAQMIARREHLWLPEPVMRRSLPGARVRLALRRIAPVAAWVDRHATGHGSWAMRAPVRGLAALACLICGLTMPFMELVIFSSSLLGMAVLLFSVSLLARDLMFLMFGLLFMAFAAAIPVFAWSAVTG